jgi:hypothetical protein
MTEITTHKKAIFSINKLEFAKDTTKKEWEEIGKKLKQFEGSVQFWIGDWLAFGEKMKFIKNGVRSKLYDEVEKSTGLDRGTLQNYKSIAEKVDPSLRNERLTYSHYSVVAPLPPEKQKMYLEIAERVGITAKGLRQQIQLDKKGGLPASQLHKMSCYLKMKPEVGEWVKTNLPDYDELQVDILNAFLMPTKKILKEHGLYAKEIIIEMIEKIKL